MQQKRHMAQSAHPHLKSTQLVRMSDEQSCLLEDKTTNMNSMNDIARKSTRSMETTSSFTQLETPHSTSILPQKKDQATGKRVFNIDALKVMIGLLVGVALLFLVSRFVNIPIILAILQQHLTTPQGIALALLSGVFFLLAYCIRGIRWKLFLNSAGKVSLRQAIQLYLVSVFLNFLLPVQGGEVSKSLMLKRISGIPMSQSLPTIALDRAFDLLPALFIIVLVPLLGVQMDIKLWMVLGFVAGLLLCLIGFIALAAYRRSAALALVHMLTGIFPPVLRRACENFIVVFVESLLSGASRPRVLLPAALLTGVAVSLDGLYITLIYWMIGYPILFGRAIFGYAVFNMFYILPNPPGQVGSNEVVALLVFTGLLHVPANKVAAATFFAHPWSALLLCTTGLACLSVLGMSIASVFKVQTEGANTPLPKNEQELDKGN